MLHSVTDSLWHRRLDLHLWMCGRGVTWESCDESNTGRRPPASDGLIWAESSHQPDYNGRFSLWWWGHDDPRRSIWSEMLECIDLRWKKKFWLFIYIYIRLCVSYQIKDQHQTRSSRINYPVHFCSFHRIQFSTCHTWQPASANKAFIYPPLLFFRLYQNILHRPINIDIGGGSRNYWFKYDEKK